jgi:tetratricopeptide (TPR) repeat protein
MTTEKTRPYGLYAVLSLVFAAAVYAGMQLTIRQNRSPVPAEMVLGGALAPEVRQTLSGSYLASQVALMREDYASAAQFADQMKGDAPFSEMMQQRHVRLLLLGGKTDEAEAYAHSLMPSKDPLVLQIELGRLLKTKAYTQALELLAQTKSPKGIEQLLLPPLKAWTRAGQWKVEPQGVFHPLKQAGGIDAFAGFMNYQRALIYDWSGQVAEAKNAYAALVRSPDAMPYRMAHAIANFHLRQGDLDGAKAVYAAYQKNHPEATIQPNALPESVDAAKRTKPVIDSLAQGAAEIYFTLASLLFGDGPDQSAMLYLRLALALRPDFPAAQMLLANLYEQQDQHTAAVEVYRAIDQNSVFYQQGRIRIALNYHAAGQSDEAIALLETLIASEPENEEAVTLLGDMYRHAKAYAKSVTVFREAEKRAPEHDWSWQFYYQYGMALDRSGQWQAAEPKLQKALKLEPNQPDVLNYLGYSWLEHGVKLQEALVLIEQAYIQSTGEAHIIDSMGWAHYALGEYDLALELLERATNLAPHDPTINEHLGDVYYRLGRTVEARYQWQRALMFEAENAEEIQQKIEAGLPPVTP